MITRRGLIGGLASFIAAPAIIKVAGIMPIKAFIDPLDPALLYRGEFMDAMGLQMMERAANYGFAIMRINHDMSMQWIKPEEFYK